jgi:hypothetical protein
MQRTDDSLTVFSKSAIILKKEYANAKFDFTEFQRKLTRCSLNTCRGMCCYGGVKVDDETATVLQQLATERASDFRAMGLSLPELVVKATEWHGVRGNITALKPFPFRELVDEYPKHFDQTACVFLLNDSRCGLQALGEMDGKHPWYYKPFSCWLLPIKIYDGEIHLFDYDSDPFRFPDYDGFFSRIFCGRTEECGQPAAIALRPELEFLGRLLDRGLVAELTPVENVRSGTSEAVSDLQSDSMR